MIDCIEEPFSIVGASGDPVDDEKELIFTAWIKRDLLVELIVFSIEPDAQIPLSLQLFFKISIYCNRR